MTSFAHIILEKGAATIRSFEQVQREDAHNIQTHAVDIASLVSEKLKGSLHYDGTCLYLYYWLNPFTPKSD